MFVGLLWAWIGSNSEPGREMGSERPQSQPVLLLPAIGPFTERPIPAKPFNYADFWKPLSVRLSRTVIKLVAKLVWPSENRAMRIPSAWLRSLRVSVHGKRSSYRSLV